MDDSGFPTVTSANLMIAKIKQERLSGNQRSLARLRSALDLGEATRPFGKTNGVVEQPKSAANLPGDQHWFASNNPRVGKCVFQRQQDGLAAGELTRTAYIHRIGPPAAPPSAVYGLVPMATNGINPGWGSERR